MNEDKRGEDGIGVHHIIIEEADKYELDEVHKHPKLPQLAEVLSVFLFIKTQKFLYVMELIYLKNLYKYELKRVNT